MTENIKAFMEKASKDKALAEKINAINKEKTGDDNKNALIDLAKTAGIELKADDFNAEEKELSEKELAQVNGGDGICAFIGFFKGKVCKTGKTGQTTGAAACYYIGVGIMIDCTK